MWTELFILDHYLLYASTMWLQIQVNTFIYNWSLLCICDHITVTNKSDHNTVYSIKHTSVSFYLFEILTMNVADIIIEWSCYGYSNHIYIYSRTYTPQSSVIHKYCKNPRFSIIFEIRSQITTKYFSLYLIFVYKFCIE